MKPEMNHLENTSTGLTKAQPFLLPKTTSNHKTKGGLLIEFAFFYCRYITAGVTLASPSMA